MDKKKKKVKKSVQVWRTGAEIPVPKPEALFGLNSEPLYCICRKEDNGELMVGCDLCDDWYHFRCLKLDPRYEKLYYKFYCPYCEWDSPANVSIYKRKCMEEGCYQPIVKNSKFCSREHGLSYFQRVKQKVQQGGAKNEVTAVLSMDKLDLAKFHTLGNKLPSVDETALAQFAEGNDEYQAEISELQRELAMLAQEKSFYALKVAYFNTTTEQVKQVNEFLTTAFLSTDDGGDAAGKTKKSAKRKKGSVRKIEICGFNKIMNLTRGQLKHFLAQGSASSFFQIPESGESDVKFDNREWFETHFAHFQQALHSIDELRSLQQRLAGNTEDVVMSGDETSTDVDTALVEFHESCCLFDKKKCLKHTGWMKRIADEVVIRTDDLGQEEAAAKARVAQLNKMLKMEYLETQV